MCRGGHGRGSKFFLGGECVFNETLWRVEFHTKKFNLKLSEQVNSDRAIAMDQNTCVQM